MAHIHTDSGQHDHTVSAYIIRTDFDEPKLMLHMHKKLHVYMQFGGHIELDETPWQALTHEVLEETGYNIEELEILQPRERLRRITDAALHPTPVSYITHPFGDIEHFHTDVGFAFVTNKEPGLPVEHGESSDFKFVTRRQIETLDTHESVRQICIFIFDEILKNWERVATSQFEA